MVSLYKLEIRSEAWDTQKQEGIKQVALVAYGLDVKKLYCRAEQIQTLFPRIRIHVWYAGSFPIMEANALLDLEDLPVLWALPEYLAWEESKKV
ncbi:MAG: hypothetical protein A2908_02575 [Candidatus Staskawiczbacteria bacterium RIFCSPLOWO2_01_FULL_38_12b]|uniref:Uncharacterized protein n=1 Tax=Candidatus Staskawiczbacteria bacterium RIFCSPLOWO2_01_FULL_38_12b TaxID=1802214 RepID=A0A1G2IBJ7_9BACT|nr:MAG: hypothetical protein A2908_02575 [Candidatus Staskawiczbacteria bacterium RIFCSPLOWO2_01_FULL_38_12b]